LKIAIFTKGKQIKPGDGHARAARREETSRRHGRAVVGELMGAAAAVAAAAISLAAALQKSATTCQTLMRERVGDRWHWPDR